MLSVQQTKIVKLIAEGKYSKEIAYELGLKYDTIKKYRGKIESRIGVKGIAEITKYAIKNNIITL